MTDRTQATYDQIAARFAAVNAAMPPELSAAIDRFLGYTGPGARVLDLGCGPGRDAAWLEGRGAFVVGVDLSAGMLAQARRRARADLARVDMRRIPFRTGCFRGVWCNAVLLHLPKSEAPRALTEVRRVLAADGTLFLSLQGGAGEIREHTRRYGGTAERFFARYGAAEAVAMLDDSGFTLLEHTAYPSGTRRWLNFLATARTRGDI